MEIQVLNLVVGEDEINQLLAEYLPDDLPVEKLHVRLSSEGIHLSGEYPALMLKMPFETRWEVSASGSSVQLRLASITVVGLPAGILRGFLLKSIKEAAAKEAGISVQEDEVRIDVEEALRARKVTLRANLTAIRCGPEGLVVEASRSASGRLDQAHKV
jgi:hypothetical protein